VLGLGNPVLSDDSVGIMVAREVEKRVEASEVTVIESAGGGLNLLDSISGFQHVIIIDAIQTAEGKAGQIRLLDPGNFSLARHLSSPHQVDLISALELGRRLELPMPSTFSIVAVEAQDVVTFGEELTAEVEQAIPEAVDTVLHELERRRNDVGHR
jgi:hydrogenase maturation protease